MPTERRVGDSIAILGDYQFRALSSPNLVQRFWHRSKMTVIDQLCKPAANDRVLDIGCGSGVVAHYLSTFGPHVTAVDGNPEAIKFARKQYDKDNLTFIEGLVDDAFVTQGPLDKIYCFELIEHIYHEQATHLLHNCHDMLTPSGQMLITTPNYLSLWPAIEWLMDRFKLAPTMKGHQHVCFYTPNRLAQLVESCGFDVIQVTTSLFLSPWVAVCNWDLPERLLFKEIHSRFQPGSIINLLCRKRS